MRSEEFTLKSSDGIHTLTGSLWLPEGTPKAALQIVHGMSEYVDRYDEFARYMTDHGYVVYGDDHLGHGRSVTDMDELGYFGEQHGAVYLVEDEWRTFDLMHKRFPDLPVFMLGHSMGSFIARAWASRYGDLLEGLIIMGTAGYNPLGDVAKFIAAAEGRRYGKHYRSKLINWLAFGSYNDKFKDENDIYSWLGRNKDIRDKYAKDPYCNFMFTIAGFETLSEILKAVSSRNWAKLVPEKLPILMVSGEMDPVGNYGKGVHEVYGWLEATGHKDLKMKLYAGMRHEILNENNHSTVFFDLLKWTNGVLEKDASKDA